MRRKTLSSLITAATLVVSILPAHADPFTIYGDEGGMTSANGTSMVGEVPNQSVAGPSVSDRIVADDKNVINIPEVTIVGDPNAPIEGDKNVIDPTERQEEGVVTLPEITIVGTPDKRTEEEIAQALEKELKQKPSELILMLGEGPKNMSMHELENELTARGILRTPRPVLPDNSKHPVMDNVLEPYGVEGRFINRARIGSEEDIDRAKAEGEQALYESQMQGFGAAGSAGKGTASKGIVPSRGGAAYGKPKVILSAPPVSSPQQAQGFGTPSGGALFPGLTEAEVGSAVDNAVSGTPAELPGQNPITGEGLINHVTKGDQTKAIPHHDNMKFKGIEGAPGSKVEVRRHSANPNAPAGSYSQSNPTTQVNSVNPKTYMLPDGTFKPLSEMTDEEKAAAHFR